MPSVHFIGIKLWPYFYPRLWTKWPRTPQSPWSTPWMISRTLARRLLHTYFFLSSLSRSLSLRAYGEACATPFKHSNFAAKLRNDSTSLAGGSLPGPFRVGRSRAASVAVRPLLERSNYKNNCTRGNFYIYQWFELLFLLIDPPCLTPGRARCWRTCSPSPRCAAGPTSRGSSWPLSATARSAEKRL